MPRAFITIVAALYVSHTPVAAEDKMVVDMSKMTCGELTKLGFQDFAGITMWMSGYYNAAANSDVLDFKRLETNTAKVLAYCKKNKSVTLAGAINKVAK